MYYKINKPLLCIYLLFFSIVSFAQDTVTGIVTKTDDKPKGDNVITTTPFGYYNKARFVYQRNIYKGITVGALAAYYYNIIGLNPKRVNKMDSKGIKAEVFFRFYPSLKSFEGFYVQIKGGFLHLTSDYQVESINEPKNSDGTVVLEVNDLPVQENITSFGGGFAMGAQWLKGPTKRFVIDFCFLNLQYYPLNYKESSLNGIELVPNTNTYTYWYLYGPAAILNPNLLLGYRF